MRVRKFETTLGSQLGLEVTKAELNEIKEKNDFVTISAINKEYLDVINDNDIAGVIFGDIEYINLRDENKGNYNCVFIAQNIIEQSFKELPLENLSFGEAVILLKFGHKVCRKGWNGKGMFLFLVPGSKFKVIRPPLLGIYPEGTEVEYHAHIDMKTAQGYIVPWLASQADIIETDWMEAN